MRGFRYSHLVMLLGIILLAVGIEEAIAHPRDHLELSYALALTGGVAVFLAGDVVLRHSLGLGRTASRIAIAVVVLPAIPIATEISAAAGLAAASGLFAAALAGEAALARPRAAPAG